MFLIVQIALGILLGYALIRNYDRIAKLAKPVLWGLSALLIVGIVIIAASLAMDAVNDAMANNPKFARVLDTTFAIAVGAVGLAFFLVGLRAFAHLVDEVAPNFFKAADGKTPIWKGLLGLAIILAFLSSGPIWGWSIFKGTAIHEFADGVDAWSRSNGYDDAGSFLLICATYLWPVPILFGLRVWQGERVAATPTKPAPPAE